ncbi:hypothetical protein AB1N83_008508 [Pleurotus pulmonarius]
MRGEKRRLYGDDLVHAREVELRRGLRGWGTARVRDTNETKKATSEVKERTKEGRKLKNGEGNELSKLAAFASHVAAQCGDCTTNDVGASDTQPMLEREKRRRERRDCKKKKAETKI